MDTYLDFCKRCSEGKVGYNKDFYVLSDNYSNIKGREQSKDISIVNPTQAAVDQAKSEVKNEKTINRVEKMKYNQTGGNSGKKKSRQSKKKAVVKGKKKSKSAQKKKTSRTNNKKGKIKKTSGRTSKSYSSIWM